jgi:hypothetical protein
MKSIGYVTPNSVYYHNGSIKKRIRGPKAYKNPIYLDE